MGEVMDLDIYGKYAQITKEIAHYKSEISILKSENEQLKKNDNVALIKSLSIENHKLLQRVEWLEDKQNGQNVRLLNENERLEKELKQPRYDAGHVGVLKDENNALMDEVKMMKEQIEVLQLKLKDATSVSVYVENQKMKLALLKIREQVGKFIDLNGNYISF